MGTVFTYADSKRDLLFLIANEDLEATTRKAEADISPGASLIANLLSAFGDHYGLFARQPELSRLMLREMVFYNSGQQAKRFQATRERIIALTGEIVRLALAREEISSPEDPRLIGWVIFCIYQVELRRLARRRRAGHEGGSRQPRARAAPVHGRPVAEGRGAERRDAEGGSAASVTRGGAAGFTLGSRTRLRRGVEWRKAPGKAGAISRCKSGAGRA